VLTGVPFKSFIWAPAILSELRAYDLLDSTLFLLLCEEDIALTQQYGNDVAAPVEKQPLQQHSKKAR